MRSSSRSRASIFPKVNRPWHEKEFTTGTDTYLAEPMVGVPTVWGYSGSGVETHHNSEDTPDRVDERSLRDISVIDASFLYFIANAGEPEALWLARLSESRGYGRDSERRLAISGPDRERRHSRGAGQATCGGGGQNRLFRGSGEPSRLQRPAACSRESSAAAMNGIETDAGRAAAIRRDSVRPHPRRAAGGSPDYHSEARDPRYGRSLEDRGQTKTIRHAAAGRPAAREMGRLSFRRMGRYPTIALYWCDGHRNLAEVSRLTRLELGPTEFDFIGYFSFLKRHGYVEFVE